MSSERQARRLVAVVLELGGVVRHAAHKLRTNRGVARTGFPLLGEVGRNLLAASNADSTL